MNKPIIQSKVDQCCYHSTFSDGVFVIKTWKSIGPHNELWHEIKKTSFSFLQPIRRLHEGIFTCKVLSNHRFAVFCWVPPPWRKFKPTWFWSAFTGFSSKHKTRRLSLIVWKKFLFSVTRKKNNQESICFQDLIRRFSRWFCPFYDQIRFTYRSWPHRKNVSFRYREKQRLDLWFCDLKWQFQKNDLLADNWA